MASPIISALALVVSIVVAFLTLRWAGRAPWHSLVGEQLNRIIHRTVDDWHAMDSLLAWPVKDAREELAQRLSNLRESVDRKLKALELLYPELSKPLMRARQRMLETWDDRFFSSDEATLPERDRERLKTAYRDATTEFLAAIRAFAETIGDPGRLTKSRLGKGFAALLVASSLVGD